MATTLMPRATKHNASYAYRKILRIFLYSTMAITLVPTIEHTKQENINSPSIGDILVLMFNLLRTLRAIA